MSHSPITAKISHLRQRSIVATLEAVLVLFGALLAIAILPSLLLRYFYDTSTLLESPKLLEYIPVAAFVLAAIYFFRALIGNMRREKQVSQLMTELENCDDGCCGSCCTDEENQENEEDWDEDLKELEELLAEVEAEEKAEKKSSTKSTKKATSKSGKVAKSAKKASKK